MKGLNPIAKAAYNSPGNFPATVGSICVYGQADTKNKRARLLQRFKSDPAIFRQRISADLALKKGISLCGYPEKISGRVEFK